MRRSCGNHSELLIFERGRRDDDDDLARLVQAGDPLVESWLRNARTVSGPDLTTRITLLDVQYTAC